MTTIYNNRRNILWDEFNDNPQMSPVPSLEQFSNSPIAQNFNEPQMSPVIAGQAPTVELNAPRKSLQDIVNEAKMTTGQGIAQAMGQMNNDYSRAVSGRAALGQAIANIGQAIGSGMVASSRNNAELQKQLDVKNYFDEQDAAQQSALQQLKDKAAAQKELDRKIYEASKESRGEYIDALNAGKSKSEAAQLLSKGYAPTASGSKIGASGGVLFNKETGKIVGTIPTPDKGYQLGSGVVLNKTTGKWEQLPTNDEWQVVPGSKGTLKMNRKGEIQSITNADYAQPGQTIAPERLTPSQAKTVDTAQRMKQDIGTLEEIASPKNRGALNSVGGIQAILPEVFQPANIGGTDAAGVKAKLDYLKSSEFLSNVENMKGQGSLTDAEGKKLSANIELISNPNVSDADRIKYINETLDLYKQGYGKIKERNPSLPINGQTPEYGGKYNPKTNSWE